MGHIGRRVEAVLPVPVGAAAAAGRGASVLGFTGAHRFYTGKIATAIVWLLTGGLLGLGALADVAAIAASRWKAADGTPLRRRAAKGSLAAAGMAVGWAVVAWMTTAAAVALTALTVALMAA